MSMKCLYCRTGKVDVKWQTPHANVTENSERLANVVAREREGDIKIQIPTSYNIALFCEQCLEQKLFISLFN